MYYVPQNSNQIKSQRILGGSKRFHTNFVYQRVINSGSTIDPNLIGSRLAEVSGIPFFTISILMQASRPYSPCFPRQILWDEHCYRRSCWRSVVLRWILLRKHCNLTGSNFNITSVNSYNEYASEDTGQLVLTGLHQSYMQLHDWQTGLSTNLDNQQSTGSFIH